jgi:endogenous inhibitor of DNA gyrase (YacG/DUF329 family)
MKHRCPICKKPTDSIEHADFPFCSERCRLLDLGAWASEKYVVSDPVFDEEEILEADRPAQQKGRHEPDETIQ